ncbi:MAG TPA: hypothetical protein VF179_10885 [Thermoanaerobaculia bacterium]|nr:hypothetical protein [Thermoanaerobaculia bacterium]
MAKNAEPSAGAAPPLPSDGPGEEQRGNAEAAGESLGSVKPSAPLDAKAAKAEPVPATKPDVNWRRVLLNLLLVALITAEVTLWFTVHLISWKSFLATLGGFATVLGLVWLVLDKLLGFFDDEIKKAVRDFLQSSKLSRRLGILALLLLVFAAPAFWLILSPPPILRILPAKRVFNLLEAAVPDQSPDYKLTLKFPGGEELLRWVSPGSIYIGAPRHYLRGRIQGLDESEVKRQQRRMNRHLDEIGVTQDKNRERFLAAWQDEDWEEFLSTRRFKAGEELVLSFSGDGATLPPLSVTITVQSAPEVQIVFLGERL